MVEEFSTPFTESYVEKGRAEGRIEGRAEGRAEVIAAMVLDVLDARGIPVGVEVRARVSSCTDVETLRTWARRAAVASSADELFD
ncbi:hypothetical protein J0910_07260 [Nocardiopsis sp. CNT-189]|uniref:hypothetical protein n=1 Tax=Nocardiopsis oceanisediminis TaxID=2816862 RepID=UPI003B32C992